MQNISVAPAHHGEVEVGFLCLWIDLSSGSEWSCSNRPSNIIKSLRSVVHVALHSFLTPLAFRPCELLPSLFVRRPSINISHFNLLLRNHWANCNQTLVELSLDGPLPKLCPVILTSNQDGHQAKNRKKWGWNFWQIFSSETTEPISTKLCWDDPGWSPSKIVSGISDLRPRWPPQPNLI